MFSVPDLADPGDRMIQVLRWYLSSFHAGRKVLFTYHIKVVIAS